MSGPRSFRGWRWSRVVIGSAVLVVAGLLWVNLAPTHLGGDAVYVVTSGVSMEPRFHTGDLAILRPAASYHVGEIVGYESPGIGIVLHRIIGSIGGRFLMKGDNNNFVDRYHPVPSDIVGRLWLHIPKLGRLVSNKGNRAATVAVAAGAMAGIIGVPGERERRRRRKSLRRGVRSASPSSGPRPATGVLGVPGQVAASVIVVVALAALALGAFSYTRSTSAGTTHHIPYRQSGVWSYRAAATGDVYANGVATTGQPIFSTVAPDFTTTFAYRFISPLPTHLTGRAGLAAVLTSSDGWSHALPEGPAVAFSGSTVRLTGAFSLAAIVKYLSSLEVATGQVRGPVTGVLGTYALTITPTVHVSGNLGGASLRPQNFSPPLTFTIHGLEAQLNGGPISTPTTIANMLAPSSNRSLSIPATTTAYLSFIGLHPSVSTARKVADWTLAVCLLALVFLGLLLRKAYGAAETDRIDARYGSILMAVERPESLGGVGSVQVATMDDLARFATHQGRMIMHCEAASGRDYFVRDQSLTYLYSVRDEASDGEAVAGLSFADDGAPRQPDAAARRLD